MSEYPPHGEAEDLAREAYLPPAPMHPRPPPPDALEA